MRHSVRSTSLLLIGFIALAVAMPSIAAERHDHDGHFAKHHPRRDQVLDRTQRQNRRITHEVREGELSHGQAHALRRNDRSVAQQQRAAAKANGGFITKQQQQSLNAELNSNSKQIGH
jgi:hypothetical protein